MIYCEDLLSFARLIWVKCDRSRELSIQSMEWSISLTPLVKFITLALMSVIDTRFEKASLISSSDALSQLESGE